MEKLIAIVKIVFQLMPVIDAGIRAVEQIMPQGGQGAAKLELVRGTIEAAFKGLEDVSVSFQDAWPAIQNVIAKLVSVYNAIGEFKKAAA
ncbi:MAG TPA: hypothetical protein VJ577_11445 [Burkholderiaceae bacterium]|nr:hypothetical protein [Burkholderiaceae bacterium]